MLFSSQKCISNRVDDRQDESQGPRPSWSFLSFGRHRSDLRFEGRQIDRCSDVFPVLISIGVVVGVCPLTFEGKSGGPSRTGLTGDWMAKVSPAGSHGSNLLEAWWLPVQVPVRQSRGPREEG